MSEDKERPPVDTSWLTTETISDGPGMAVIIGLAFVAVGIMAAYVLIVTGVV